MNLRILQKLKKVIRLDLILVTLIFFTSSLNASSKLKLPVTENEFKIMSYNILNLFDADHDEGKNDYTFLPLSYKGKSINCKKISNNYYREQCLTTNWTKRKVSLKVKQLKKVIDMQGSLPEVLAVQEIENAAVAHKLGKALGYSGAIISDSPDKRGIDVAIFFRNKKLKYINHDEINVSYELGFKTRNILRAHFQPINSKSILAVYANHWPSQAAAPVARLKVAKILKRDIDAQVEAYGADNYFVVVTGDFNTKEHETPNAFHQVINSPSWDNHLIDVQGLSKRAKNPMTYKMPPGTYWYGREGTWNTFDRIFISKNLWSPQGITLLPKSFRIIAGPLNSVRITRTGRSTDWYQDKLLVPFRGDFHTTTESKLGFSDHYPVVAKFRIN